MHTIQAFALKVVPRFFPAMMQSPFVVRLHQGVYLVLEQRYSPEWETGFDPVIDAIGRELSASGPCAYLATCYHGGSGDQAAMLWSHGEVIKVYNTRDRGPINEVLEYLGVVAGDAHDEFDAVGLGSCRDNEKLHRALTEKEPERYMRAWLGGLPDQTNMPTIAKALS